MRSCRSGRAANALSSFSPPAKSPDSSASSACCDTNRPSPSPRAAPFWSRSRAFPCSSARAELQGKARDLLQKGAARGEGDGRFVSQQALLALESGDFAGGEKLLKAFAARPDRQDRMDADLMLAEYY